MGHSEDFCQVQKMGFESLESALRVPEYSNFGARRIDFL
jgi:hypothetical protein